MNLELVFQSQWCSNCCDIYSISLRKCLFLWVFHFASKFVFLSLSLFEAFVSWVRIDSSLSHFKWVKLDRYGHIAIVVPALISYHLWTQNVDSIDLLPLFSSRLLHIVTWVLIEVCHVFLLSQSGFLLSLHVFEVADGTEFSSISVRRGPVLVM